MSKYTVIFYDDDRTTILDKQEVDKGEKVTYNGVTPTKAPENGIEYAFSGWETTGNITCVMEDINLFAKYEAGKKDNMFELSQQNAEAAKLNEVMEAGKKVQEAEKATRDMTVEQKKDLINEIKDKGSVNLDKQAENERD